METDLHRNAALVVAAAQQHDVAIHVQRFPDGTRTAAEAAAAVGVGIGQIVKSLIFAVGDSPFDAVSTHRVGHGQRREQP